MNTEKKSLLYEGKAKIIYETSDPNQVIVHFKDDATAFNAQKTGSIRDKGVVNNEVSSMLYSLLETKGIKTHFLRNINEREQLCEKVKIIPIEVIVRNLIAGSMAKRLGIEEGTQPNLVIFEICYKNDALNDPLINDHHAVAMNLVSYEMLDEIYEMTGKINDILKSKFLSHGMVLVDAKFEFGVTESGILVLADEISPDTCRLWDQKSGYKLDKDRFRRDLGHVEEAYCEVLNRLRGSPS